VAEFDLSDEQRRRLVVQLASSPSAAQSRSRESELQQAALTMRNF
jgi:hypothetical protein